MLQILKLKKQWAVLSHFLSLVTFQLEEAQVPLAMPMYWSDLGEFDYWTTKSQPYFVNDGQDTEVSQHLIDKPNHKVDFNETDVMN